MIRHGKRSIIRLAIYTMKRSNEKSKTGERRENKKNFEKAKAHRRESRNWKRIKKDLEG
jgi:hypothetical protein